MTATVKNVQPKSSRRSAPRQFFSCAAGELIANGIPFEFKGSYLKSSLMELYPHADQKEFKGRIWAVEYGDYWTSFDDIDSFEEWLQAKIENFQIASR